ncbi:dyslexia-associated protein KIAA0319-like isoform 1-T2 [Pholidichthys leucotaenia]
MWERTFVILLHSLEAAVASQCLRGATFSQAVVSPAADGGGILRVPGAGSLSQCVAACCRLPDYDLAWFLRGHCYILSCRGGEEECRPSPRPGARSVLAFLRRAPPTMSLVRTDPRRTPSGSSEAPGDLEALKDLAVFEGPLQDLWEPGMEEYSEGSPETNQPPLEGASYQSESREEEEEVRGVQDRTRSPSEETQTVNSSGPLTLDPGPRSTRPAGETLTGTTEPGLLQPSSSSPSSSSSMTLSVTSDFSITTQTAESDAPPPPPPLPPVAHASGSHVITLPNNSLILRGSVTHGDQTQVHFLWTRDSQSPAAGDVLYGSESQPCLYLSNLVEGTYLFTLRVTDSQGRSSTATSTVEVRPEPGGGEQVEVELQVSISQLSVSQRDTVVRQLSSLLHVPDTDVQVRGLQGHSQLSTVMRFVVRGPSGVPVSSAVVASLLRNQLTVDKNHFLLFRVLRVDTVLCLLLCSGRGQCHPITKQCVCDAFWTENLIRRYLGDGESNCEWRILHVVLSSFLLVIFILFTSWTFVCCCRRRPVRGRKKTDYSILDNMDDQERMELRPRFSLKHRSTDHNHSLMMSESDSDQDRPDRTRTRTHNGNTFI